MSIASTRWIKRAAEFRPKSQVDLVPRGLRGIYVLFRGKRLTRRFDVVYVGLSKTGLRARLRSHRKRPRKSGLWTHFSIFEVWDNVMDAEIAELEGLFRHIYRRDAKANRLSVQKSHRPFKRVRLDDLRAWNPSSSDDRESQQ